MHRQLHQTLATFTIIRMATVKQTLSDYLRSKNPVIDNSLCKSGSCTISRHAPYLFPVLIEQWQDFHYDSLQKIYGGVLHQILRTEYSWNDHSNIPRKPHCEIVNESSLELLLGMWNWRVVSEGLLKAQKSLYGRRNSNVIYMVKGGRAQIPAATKFFPDWAGTQKDPKNDKTQEGTSKPPNILPGDSKLAKKWSSNKIIDGFVRSEKSDWLKPLRQIYTYCVKANARYGYIITDEEVVVVRVRPNIQPDDLGETNDSQEHQQRSESSGKNKEMVDSQASFSEVDEGHDFILPSPVFREVEGNGRLEYKAIPWRNAASRDPRLSNTLTVNLALWWLYIMASVSSNIKEQYAPLKEVAIPSCFRNVRHNLPLKSRKRGSSAVSGGSTTSDDSDGDYHVEYRRSIRKLKRLRLNDDDGQTRRQTRSMVSKS